MKNINEVINNYLETGYNSINPNDHDGLCKSTFNDITNLYESIGSYEDLFLNNSDTKNKPSLNHIISSYYFTNKMIGENSGEMTEMAMLFLQTYLRTLKDAKNNNLKLTHDRLFKYFTVNQEILNLPYAWALYLGGVYYFNENKIEYPIDNNEVYKITNNLTASNSKYSEIGTDIYQSKLLIKYPTNYYEGNNGEQEFNINNVRILNRSLFDTYEFASVDQNTTLTNMTTYYYSNNQRIPELKNIYYHKTMSPFGFGIQNQFLNAFNNYLFNDHLNGRNDRLDNIIDGEKYSMGATQPYSIIGGDLGIIKPIKTYNSDIEFTAFYRIPIIGDFKITKEQIINDFENQITAISNTIELNIIRNEITKLFITFSKIKILYLKELISDDDLLGLFTTLANSNKLGIKYTFQSNTNNIGQVIDSDSIQISDIYHIILNVFFSSYKYIGDKNKITLGSRKDNQNLYDKIKTSKNVVQQVKNNLPPYLFNLTGLSNIQNLTQTNQVHGLIKFLTKLWDSEKTYLKREYEQYNQGDTFIALYPSAGGVFFPDQLFHNIIPQNSKDEYQRINVKRSNKVSSITKDIAYNGSFRNDIENDKKRYSIYSNDEIPLPYDRKNNSIYFPTDNDYVKLIKEMIPDSSSYYGDPMYPEFLVPNEINTNKTSLNRNGYQTLILNNFDNNALLKNTTRFLWFDNANFGLDLQVGDMLNFFDLNESNRFECIDKFDDIEYRCNHNTYFNHLDYGANKYEFDRIRNSSIEEINEFISFNKKIDNKFRDQFKLRTILDSVDLDKLEFFKKLFIEFSSSDKTIAFNSYNDKFTLKSLIMSSMMILSSEINPIAVNNINYTTDNLIALMIGNSMYNYDFLAISEISKIINSALTLSQYNRFNNVSKELNKMPIQIANLTQYGQVEDINGDYYIQPHNLTMLPEIMFSGIKNYDELLAKYKEKNASLTDEQIGVYFFRKAYFGNKYVNPYNPSVGLDRDTLEFISKYLYEDNIVNVESSGNIIIQIVNQFFKDINVEITESNVRYLLKPLRTYIRDILVDNKLYNETYSYGKKLLTRDEVANTLVSEKPDVVKRVESKLDSNSDEVFNNWLKASNDFSNF